MKALVGLRSRWLIGVAAVLAFVVVVGLVSAGIAGAIDVPITFSPDGYEVDDSMSMAKPIEINGAPQSRSIHAAGDIDWVKFDARAGSVYVADVPDETNATAINGGLKTLSATVLIELYDAQGNMLYTTRDQIGDPSPMTRGSFDAKGFLPSWWSTLVWRAPKTGTYYLRVVPYTQAPFEGVGDYLLRLRNVNDSIVGKVVYSDTGKPAPYTFVAASSVGAKGVGAKDVWAMGTYTDQNGEYILYNLAQGQQYDVWFDPNDDEVYQPEYWDGKHEADVMSSLATPDFVLLGNADPIVANASLDLYAPSISGKVVDPSGKPAVGVTVYATQRAQANAAAITGSWSTLTDSSGNYDLRNLADGEWIINFVDDERMPLPPRYISEYWDDQSNSIDADGIEVSLGAAEGSYDATLAVNPLVASGTVKNKKGEPVAWADVQLYALTPDEIGAQSTAPAGYTPFGSAEANESGYWEYRGLEVSETFKAAVDFSDWEYPQYQEQWYSLKTNGDDANTFGATSEAPASNINFVLDYVDPYLSGTVTDAITGARLPGIQVWAYVENAWGDIVPFEFETTDANGNYRFQEPFYPGMGDREVFVGFFDTSGMYAQEYWDNKQQLNLADATLIGYMRNQFANAALMPKPGRLYGQDRYSTAAAIAANRFPGWVGATNVVVASGDDAAAPDPLAAASLCWAYDAPMLLTSVREPNAQTTINTLKQIQAANPGVVKVYVVGGPNSVPQARIDELSAIVGAANVERLPYGDRYETAKQIALRSRQVAADASKPFPNFVIVANGADPEKFGDALSSSAISGANGAPILLVKDTSIPAPTTSALGLLAPSAVYVAGGPTSVNASVYAGLGGTARMWGPNRYSTSVAIAQTSFDKAWLYVEKIGIAARVPDALTGGVSMGNINGPLLVTRTNSLPGETYAFIHKYNQIINQVVVFGGPKSVNPVVKNKVDEALVHP